MNQKAEEPLLVFADRKGREIADQQHGPITLTPRPDHWWNTYWIVLGGYGFRPYVW